MKKLIAFICVLALISFAVYGCAKSSTQSEPDRSIPLTIESDTESQTPKSLLLCLPSENTGASDLLRTAFETQAEALGLTVYVSQPSAAGISDTEQWDLDQLQYNADGIAVFTEDTPDEGLLRKWRDAGKTTVVCGATLDPAAEADGTKYVRLVGANVALSQSQLSKSVAKHITDTLSGENYSSGSIGIYTAPDGDDALAASLQGDISLYTSAIYATGNATSAANAEGYAGEISGIYSQLSDIRAFVFLGGNPDVWASARKAAGKTNLLTGMVGYSAAAVNQVVSGGLDFVAFCDYRQMGTTAADTLSTLLFGGALENWSTPIAPALLTNAAMAQAYIAAAN